MRAKPSTKIQFFQILLGLILLAGCQLEIKTVPSVTVKPQTISGSVDENNQFLVCKFDSGPALLVVDRLGTGGWRSTSDRFAYGLPYVREGSANAADPTQQYQWKLESEDGKSATFELNKVSYDLTKQNVFRIELVDGELVINPMALDLKAIAAEEEACKAFILAHPEILETLDVESPTSE